MWFYRGIDGVLEYGSARRELLCLRYACSTRTEKEPPSGDVKVWGPKL